MASRSFFGRIADKAKSIAREIFFVEETKPAPKPQPKKSPTPSPTKRKLPTERPQPKKKSPEQIRKEREASDRARTRRLRREQRERDAFSKIEGFVGDAEDAYGNPTFDATNVRQRLRRLPNEQSLVDIINATNMDEIDEIYANDQIEFTGYDQPAGFWYH